MSGPEGQFAAKSGDSEPGLTICSAPGRREGKTLSSPTDTLENTPHPDAASREPEHRTGHEQADHDHDHDEHGHGQEPEHDHQHGPVLNPDCTRELVLDIAAEEVSKAYGKVVGNYKKHAKIPGFRAGKVPTRGQAPLRG